jgi:DNA-binding transcriptional regulator YiaG
VQELLAGSIPKNHTVVKIRPLFDSLEFIFCRGDVVTCCFAFEDAYMPLPYGQTAIRDLRRMRRLTIPMAAAALSVSVLKWRAMEWGERLLPHEHLGEIAVALGAGPAALIASVYEPDERLRLAKWLYDTRVDRGMSLAVASFRLGIGMSTLRLWETGQTPVPPSHIVRIARAFDLPMSQVTRQFSCR